MPVTLTGTPDNLVGENRARLAASTAASRSDIGPETAFAAITFPFSSTTTSTSTLPAERIRRAFSGYLGTGKFNAFPFSTPPETGLSMRGGGAFSLATATFVELVETARLAPGGWTAAN